MIPGGRFTCWFDTATYNKNHVDVALHFYPFQGYEIIEPILTMLTNATIFMKILAALFKMNLLMVKICCVGNSGSCNTKTQTHLPDESIKQESLLVP